MYMHVCGDTGLMAVISLSHSLPYVLKYSSSLNPELTTPANQLFWLISLLLGLFASVIGRLGLQMATTSIGPYMHSGNQNPGPHARVASILPR